MSVLTVMMRRSLQNGDFYRQIQSGLILCVSLQKTPILCVLPYYLIYFIFGFRLLGTHVQSRDS